MPIDRDAIERVRNSPEFAAIMECLWRDLQEARSRIQEGMALPPRDQLEYAAALVLDHWKHGDHLEFMLPRRAAAVSESNTGGGQ